MPKDGNKILRGEVYWATLDPAVGSEIKKTRPVVIVSNNIQNANAPRIVVVPVTSSTKRVLHFEALIKIGDNTGKALADQVRTIDKSRLEKLICKVADEELSSIDDALKIVLHLR
jgi:mRNA interferase MazF